MAIDLSRASNTLGHIFSSADNVLDTAMEHKYLIPRPNEKDSDYVKRVGITAAQRYLKPAAIKAAVNSIGSSAAKAAEVAGATPVEAKAAGDAAAGQWSGEISSGATALASGLTNYATTGDAGEAAKAGVIAGGVDYAKKYAAKELATRAGLTAAQSTPIVGAAVGGIMGMFGEGTDREKVGSAMGGAIKGAISSTGVGAVAVAAMEAAKAIGSNISSNKGANARVGVTYDPEGGLTFLRSASGKGEEGGSIDMLRNLPPSVRGSLEAELKAETEKRIASVEGMDPSVVRALGRDYFSPSLRIEGEDIAEWNKKGGYFVTENMKSNIGLDNSGRILYSSQTENDLGNAQRLASHNVTHGTTHTVRDLMTAQAEGSRGSEDMYNIGTSQANILDVGNASRSITQGVEGRDVRGTASALAGTGDATDSAERFNPYS